MFSCHARQGFKEGDLIGGLSIVFPSSQVASILFHDTVRNVSIYIMISIILLVTAIILQKRIYNLNVKQEETIKELNTQIFHREKGEQALVRQTRMASQGELLTLVAHHWRQPLNAVSLTLDVLRYHLEENKVKDENPYADITHSQMLIQELSKSIDMFRQQYADENERIDFSITKAVVESCKLFEPVLNAGSVKIWIECMTGDNVTNLCLCSTEKREKKNCPLSVFTTRGSLNEFNQIMLALLKNAYEAIIEQRQRTTEVRQGTIIIKTILGVDTAEIFITDNGIGIPAKDAEQVFEPYFTTKGYDYGRGTGLYFARSLASKFENGDISFISDGERTEFKFTLKISNRG